MLATTFSQWKKWVEDGFVMLPLIRRFAMDSASVPSWSQAWAFASSHSFVLESSPQGRYSYLGLQPRATISGKGFEARIDDWQNGTTAIKHGAPLALIKQWMAPFRVPRVADAPFFTGGCVGFLGYDVARSWIDMGNHAHDDLPCPDYYMMMVDELWIVDHKEQQLYCVTHVTVASDASVTSDTPVASDASETSVQHGASDLRSLYDAASERAEAMKATWDAIVTGAAGGSAGANSASAAANATASAVVSAAPSTEDTVTASAAANARVSAKTGSGAASSEAIQPPLQLWSSPTPTADMPMPKEAFLAAVRHIQDHIRRSEVEQVNLSLRQSREVICSAEDIYERLRKLNPSPYMGLLRFPHFQLVCGSPELLIQLQDGKLRSRPIGGTRRRGRDEREDALLAQELLACDKERQEHRILVTLECEDLESVAEDGSVRVTEEMVVEYYSHVMHLVSEVQAELAVGKDGYDVLAATFPGGSVTGRPKQRTLQLIEQYEPVRRGPYTGSIGWIDYHGNMAFNITIRTLLLADGIAYVQAGAGIVSQSDPEQEYEESLNKMKALWQAVEYSEG